LRFSRLPSAQASERSAVGAEAKAPLLPTALAVAALDAAHPAACEGADAERSMPRGPPRCHRRLEPHPPRMGQLLPHRECSEAVCPSRRLRRVATPLVACEAQGTEPAARRSQRLDARLLREPRPLPPARNDPLPRAVLLATGGRVMLRVDRPPVSRV